MIGKASARLLAVALVVISVVASSGSAWAAEPPVKLIVESQFGAKANNNGASFCLEALGECKPLGAEASGAIGGFGELDPRSVAVDNHAGPDDGDIYAVDEANARVQVLTPTGEFVSMFGKDVNETSGTNLCTEVEVKAGTKCKEGVRGSEAGAFGEAESITIDPVSGDVYVGDIENSRVDEYTETGEFILMIGREVNETKDAVPTASEAEKNLCTAESGNICKGGVKAAIGGTEHSAFNMPDKAAILAAGGPRNDLYVGDEGRVQVFEASTGKWSEDISLTQVSSAEATFVRAIALDQNDGEIYLSYSGPFTGKPQLLRTILKLDESGKQVGEIVLEPREVGAQLEIEGIALDSNGRLAVTEHEETHESQPSWFGSLFHASTGELITGFAMFAGQTSTSNVPGIAFGAGEVGVGEGEKMYGAFVPRHEIVGYSAKIVAEPVTGQQLTCEEEGEEETLVTLHCELNGQINPENVGKTEAWFLWSNTERAFGGPGTHETEHHLIATGDTLVPVASAIIHGLRPDEMFNYELAGLDELVTAPQPPFNGGEVSTVTSLVRPQIVAKPMVSFVSSSKTVMYGELNPENAPTEYFFEYAPGEALEKCPLGVRKESCPLVATTPILESATYGTVPTTLEATGLQPGTAYHYRLSAESHNVASERRTSLEVSQPEDEGEFTTSPAPVPQAETGSASVIGTTSAMISGAVNPDGQPATYRFELGIYKGSSTQYGIVSTGSIGANSVPVAETLALSGLQAGVEYAYRIEIQSGYGTAYGATLVFSTVGLPSAIAVPGVLAQLPVPSTAFPKESTKVTTKKLTRAQALARALKACEKMPKDKRAACKSKAHKKYPVSKKTGKSASPGTKGRRKDG
jgi:hypothetical protein